MIEKFQDYMWYLLHYPLKAKGYASKIYILFIVLGMLFDDIKERFLGVHKQGNILTATCHYLDLHGKDRDMPRLKNEDDESYRKRLLLKVEIAKRAGTKKGLELALLSLGYYTNIKPVYEVYPERWAEFYVIMYEPKEKEVYDFDIVKNTVMDVKQASSKPNYIFKYPIHFDDKNIYDMRLYLRLGINFYGGEYLYFDDSWDFGNDKYFFDGIKVHAPFKDNNAKLNIKTTIKNDNKITINNLKLKFPINYINNNNVNTKSILKFSINFYGGQYLYFDNTWNFENDKYFFNGIKAFAPPKTNNTNIKIKINTKTNIKTKGKIQIDSTWYFDGEYCFDGSCRFDSGIIEEELN